MCDHEHTHDHDHVHEHTHEHSHDHTHPHVHPHAKAVSNRLAKAIGHLEAVKRMVDRGDDCAEVLTQLAAVRSALTNTGKVIMIDHLNECIIEAVESGDYGRVEEFSNAIKQFIK